MNYFKSRFFKPENPRQRNLFPNVETNASFPRNPHRILRLERNSSFTTINSSKFEVGFSSVNEIDIKQDEGSSSTSSNRKRSILRDNSEKFDNFEKEDEEEEDPLSFLRIQSAAQWKAMSHRISWVEDKENGVAKEEKFDRLEKRKLQHSTAPSKKRNIEGATASNFGSKSYTVKITPTDMPVGFKPTTVAQLRLVCWKIKPWNNSNRNRRLFSSQFAVQWNVDCDEVYPGLFIGDKNSASNLAFLKKLGITHVLNTAEGNEEGLVNLSQAYYAETNITYQGFPLWDCPNCNIFPYLGAASEFIKSSLEKGGKCLVNCQMGVSRSCSCAMSYLMIYEEMKAVDVLAEFRRSRDVRPNDGFLQIICDMDNELRKEREYGLNRWLEFASVNCHRLPFCYHFEFWVTPSDVTEEDIGGPLISLLEDDFSKKSARFSAKASKSSTPQRRSRSTSTKSSFRASRAVSRNGSLNEKASFSPSICLTPPEQEITDEDEWEWVWESDNENAGEDVENIKKEILPSPSPLTIRKLEKVKDIIDKPEERWRILWEKQNIPTPSPAGSLTSRTSSLNQNLIQPKVEDGEMLDSLLLKVDSAKRWKSISKKLSINFDDINISESKDTNSFTEKNGATEPIADFSPTLPKQLRLLCWTVKPWGQPRERNLFTSVMASGWGVDCDEVYPNIFLGDEASARNLAFLKKIGITHVLNTAEGIWTKHSFVNLSKEYYRESEIIYQGFELWDHPGVDISRYFGPANELVSSCVSKGGKILIHCQMGVSRSCVCAMSYLMLSEKWSAVETLRTFRKRRDVRPNDNFLSQLADLDNDLRKQRDYGSSPGIKIYSLKDVPSFPKPYHFEFWTTPPSEGESLPFILRSIRDDEKPVLKNVSSEASSEWESYSETDDELPSSK